MAIIYAQPTSLEKLDPVELGIELDEAVAGALIWLVAMPDDMAGTSRTSGKWSAKEVLGHLIDSAVNNLARIVRLETVLDIEPEVRADHYEQEAWVDAQHYAAREWADLLALWHALNTHIAWTMRRVSRHKLTRICVFPDTQMAFGFVMEDYVAHLRHHLTAMQAEAADISLRGV